MSQTPLVFCGTGDIKSMAPLGQTVSFDSCDVTANLKQGGEQRMDFAHFQKLMQEAGNPIIASLHDNPRCSVEKLDEPVRVEPCIAVAEGKDDYFCLTLDGRYGMFPKADCEVHGVFEGEVVAIHHEPVSAPSPLSDFSVRRQF